MLEDWKDRPAFEVRVMDGISDTPVRVYKIWADGRIEGFTDGPSIIINHIPTIIAAIKEAV